MVAELQNVASEFANDSLAVLISEERIRERVQVMGTCITRDYAAGDVPLLVGVLKGACLFMSDLLRAIDLRVEVDFIAISSYGGGTCSSGEVQLIKDLSIPVENRDVLVVEDIVETGLTTSYLIGNLKARGARSVKLVALLTKPDRRKEHVVIDYPGFTIPNAFVVGYGLDYDERYRNLPFVAVMHNGAAGHLR